jgi:excisionase family DNA binding protein
MRQVELFLDRTQAGFLCVVLGYFLSQGISVGRSVPVKRAGQTVQKRSKRSAPVWDPDKKIGQTGQIGRTNKTKRAVKAAKPAPVPDDQKDSVSAGEAARQLGISSRSLRRLCSTGHLPSFRTPGGQVRVRRKHLDAYAQGDDIGNSVAPSRVDGKREELQSLNLELQERRLRRDLKRLDEEDAEVERKRAAMISAEESRNKAAIEESRLLREEREQERLEEEQQREADEEWQQWADSWLEYGLKSLPANLPREFVLQVRPAIEEALRTVSPTRPRTITEQLVLAAIQRAVEPWKRQQEVEKAIKQATEELPFEIRTLSDWLPPTDWERRAMALALEAVPRLSANASLGEVRAVAIAAGRQVASEYAAGQARAREEQQRSRQASSKSFLVSMGVAEVGSHLKALHMRDEIFDEDLERKNELETLVRAALEERLTGSESFLDAQRLAREVVNDEVGA